jgi:hypothetical protein
MNWHGKASTYKQTGLRACVLWVINHFFKVISLARQSCPWYLLNTTRGVWRYSSTHSRPRHQMEVSCQLHAPSSLPPGKTPKYPLDRKLGGPQSRSGRGPGRESNPGCPASSLVTTMTAIPDPSFHYNTVTNEGLLIWINFCRSNYSTVADSFVNTAMNLWIQQKTRKFLTSWATISLSSRTVLRVSFVNYTFKRSSYNYVFN